MEAQLDDMAMLSLPRLWNHQKLNGQAPLEVSSLFALWWGKFCSAEVQLSTLMGCFDLLLSLNDPRLILRPSSGFRFEFVTIYKKEKFKH